MQLKKTILKLGNIFIINEYNRIFAAMIKKSSSLFISILIVFTIVISSCSHYQKLLKSNNNEQKYEMAVKYYESKNWEHAQPLFEQLLTISKGTSKYEMIYYYYANCFYQMGDNEEASFYFDNFVTTFPNSKFTEECSFLAAFCSYMDSPNAYLDQSNTKKAMLQLQLFANKYPKSTKVDECNQLIDLLREKLQKKEFENGKLYYNMSDFRAAVVCFKNLVKNYPETKYKEDCQFLTVKSYYLWANKSIETKKEERYKAAVENYTIFIDTNPKSKYVKEAEGYYVDALKQLDRKRQSGS